MGRKNIYLVQVSEQFSGNNKAAYLPYAAGTIAAKAWNNTIVQDVFSLERIVFLREPVGQVAESMITPFLVGFSCYIWNFEYNKALAAIIKSKHPECHIVFGGHHVPSGFSLLEECSFIDILVHGEGEEVFEKLLCVLAYSGNLSDVPNITFRKNGEKPMQSIRVAVTDVDYPSPYTAGIFDSILAEHPDMQFSAILETNRGCSNRCAFCDWGPLKTRVRMFPLERVKGDIKWFSNNRVAYIWGADANYGQFDRDVQIADWLIEAKMENGYPSRMKVNYAKYNNKNVFDLARKFSDADFSKSTTISFQTLSSEALKNVGRSNMTMEHFSELVKLYRAADIPTYSEMILALPGETYQSFTSGIGKLLESGQHSVIEIYDCVLLPNSILADKEYIEKFRINTVHVPFVLYHCEAANEEITEYSDIVISTSSMSSEEWVDCKLFSVVVQSMHCLGLLRCFSIFLHNETNIAYNDFYLKFTDWCSNNPNTLCGGIFIDIVKLLHKMQVGINVQYYYEKKYGDVLWYLDEGVFFRVINNLDRFYDEVSSFLKTFYIEDHIFDQLMNYQKGILCTPGKKKFEIFQNYDFYSYMLHSLNNDYKPLKRIDNTFVCSPAGVFNDLAEYAREIVWYGRRLGKTICTSNPDSVRVIY